MNELSSKLKEWWFGLGLREKKVVSVGGFTLLAFMLYQCIWSPYTNYISSMRERIATDQKLLNFMHTADEKIKKMPGQNPAFKSGSLMLLLNTIKNQIKQTGLEPSLTQLKQAGNEGIEMHFQKVEFNALMKLLNVIIKEQGVSLAKVSVNEVNAQGVVNADVVMSRAR